MRTLHLLCSVAVGAILLVNPAFASTFNLTPASNWLALLGSPTFLQPGDEVILGAGTYSTSSRLSLGQIGTAANPITIRAADGANVILTRPDAGQNTVNIEGAQYLTIKGIEITNGSAGIRITDRAGVQSKFITLDGNHIHHTANAAVTANFPGRTYEGMHFARNHIHDTGQEGEGFYLGCNNNACQFFDGIIEQNYIHDLNGPTVSQGDGIELKDGSYNNIIRDNVIHDTNFPGILAYGVEENGARNIIERNVVWNSGDNAIQVAADAIVRNNLIFSSAVDGIHSQNHQGAIPGNLTITNNTIRTSNNAIDIGFPSGGAFSGPIEISNNALYPGGSFAIDTFLTTGITSEGNVGTGGSSGLPFDSSGNLTNDFIDFLNKNGFPSVGSKLIGAGISGSQAADDFNTTSRTGSNDAGAYIFNASGNPGWTVGEAFKEFPVVAAGVPGDFNDDGVVNAADYTVWLDNLGSGFDLNGNGEEAGGSAGVVDAADYSLWKLSFGNTSGAGTGNGAVPEPSSILLLCLGMIAWAGRRRRLSA